MRRIRKNEINPPEKQDPKYEEVLAEADMLIHYYRGYTPLLRRADFVNMAKAMQMWKARALQAEEWLEKNVNQRRVNP